MSDEEYFSDKYKNYLSNSKLGLLHPGEGGSLEKFQQGFKSDYSDSYELGSAVHCMLLQPDDFVISDIRKPSAKLGIFAENVFKLRQRGYKIVDAIKESSITCNYYSKGFSEKRIKAAITGSLDFYLKRMKVVETDGPQVLYLSESLFEKYSSCMTSIAMGNEIPKYLYPEGLLQNPETFNEYAILCELKVTTDEGEIYILPIKGKIDNFTIDDEQEVITLNDLKTTGKKIDYFMGNYVYDKDGTKNWYNGSFQKYHYYRQMGLYFWLLQAALINKDEKYKNYTLKANMLVVETVLDFSARVFPVGGRQITEGLQEFKNIVMAFIQWIGTKN